MVGGVAGCCRLVWLGVRGFKSLRDVVLRVPGGFAVLVGPNGSGKTALIESLLLLRDVVWYLRGRVVNPFLRWWGYGNVVWRGDESRTIELGVGLDCSRCSPEQVKRLLLEKLGVNVPDEAAGLAAGGLEYWVSVSGAGGSFTIARERLCIQGFGCAVLEGSTLTLAIEEKTAARLAERAAAGASHYLVLVPAFQLLRSSRAPFKEFLEMRKECVNEALDVEEEAVRELAGLLHRILLSGVRVPFGKARSLLEFYAERIGKENYEIDVVSEAEVITYDIIASIVKLYSIKDVLVRLSEQLAECLSRHLPGLRLDAVKAAEKAAREVAWRLLTSVTSVMLTAALVVGAFLDSIVVLRLLDYRGLRSPQPLEPGEALREDGSNLVSVLFRLGRGRLPEEVSAVLAAVLGAERVSGFFEPTPDGRLVLRLVVDDVVLAPPSIPEGAWKTMAVMAAALSGAGLVAVDEFENSLHASAQELLLEELRGTVPTVIVATHSPIVVDAAKSLDEIAVVELEAGETRIRRIRSPQSLAAKLRELGVTPSEALLYGLLETEEEHSGAQT